MAARGRGLPGMVAPAARGPGASPGGGVAPRGPAIPTQPPPRGPPPTLPPPGLPPRGSPVTASPAAHGAPHGQMPMPGMGMGMGMMLSAKNKPGEDLHQKESSEIYHGAEHNDVGLLQQGITGGGDINVSNLQGVTPLLLAVKNQNSTAINILLKAGANVSAVAADSSPVHEAVRKSNGQILATLLDNGGQVNLPLSDGKTPLHLALQQNNHDLINYLLSRGADPKARTQQNVTCLHFASAEGDKEMIEKFLGYGNQVNEQNANGKTPLHVAVEKNQLDGIKVLLNAGADVKIKDAWGRLAEECGKQTAYKLLHAHKPGQKYEFIVVNDDEAVLPHDE